MKISGKLFFVINALVGALAFAPGIASADNTLTFYTQVVDGPPASPAALGPATDALSSDVGTPGARYVQESNLYSGSSFTGYPVGKVRVACTELMALLDAECVATFIFNGTDSITIAGFYTESAQQPPQCISVNYLAITGGTGKYRQARGQVKATHIPVFQPSDDVNQCQHEIHDYRYDISLDNQDK